MNSLLVAKKQIGIISKSFLNTLKLDIKILFKIFFWNNIKMKFALEIPKQVKRLKLIKFIELPDRPNTLRLILKQREK